MRLNRRVVLALVSCNKVNQSQLFNTIRWYTVQELNFDSVPKREIDITRKLLGSFGQMATCSFYPAHHITMGEGGAIFTNNLRIKRMPYGSTVSYAVIE